MRIQCPLHGQKQLVCYDSCLKMFGMVVKLVPDQNTITHKNMYVDLFTIWYYLSFYDIRITSTLHHIGSENPLVQNLILSQPGCKWVPMISFCTAQLSLAKLLGGFNPKNMKVSWDMLGWLFPIYGKIKHVLNHQPSMFWNVLEWSSDIRNRVDSTPLEWRPYPQQRMYACKMHALTF